MRIVYFGSGEFAVPILQAALGAGHEVAAVVTQPDRPAGRGRKLQPTPVCRIARECGLRVMAVEKVNEPAVTQEILGLGARIGVVAAFGQKIGKALLEGFPAGLINAHASLLPKYRGAAPVNWAILNGEDETGVTVFRLVEAMDAGPILVMRRTAIEPAETAEQLEARLSHLASDAVLTALAMFETEDDPPMTVQDESKATRAPKLARKDGYVDFTQSAKVAACRVCGLWPWPGAACEFVKADGSRRERVILCRAEAVQEAGSRTSALADNPPVAPRETTEVLEDKPLELGRDLQLSAAPGGAEKALAEKLAVSPGGAAALPATAPSAGFGEMADSGNDKSADGPRPGTVLADLSVRTGQGAIRIIEIKPAGGRRMTFEEFARGRRVTPGDRFMTLEPDMLVVPRDAAPRQS